MGWLDTLKKAAQGPARHDLTPEQRKAAARDLVQMSSLAAGAVVLAPIPLVDFVAITPIQAAMVMAVGRVHGRVLNLKEAKSVLVELASVCGAGLLARQLFTTATKFLLPGLGGVLSAPYAFAVTWAMGQVATKYFEDPSARETLKQVFEDALAEGKRLFSREAVEEFRRKRGAEVDEFARDEAEAEAPAAPKPAKKAAKAKPAAKRGKRPTQRKKRPTRPAP
ncbi:MAG: DUF697 domain-containing protein [Deltaproteobacteria bacterium]|nr:DUF697 domain-containing protein [Deltaproteobacteria bacterium]